MDRDRLQVLIWALVPMFGLFLLVLALLARGGWLLIVPISLMALGAGVLYLLWLNAPSRK
jgi:hypothetical protein